MTSTNNPSSPPPRSGRGGRGRGRGRGRGNNKSGNLKFNNKADDSNITSSSSGSSNAAAPDDDVVDRRTEQQVLIEFGPYVRSGHWEAAAIHAAYLSSHDQAAFLREARSFLRRVTAKAARGDDADDAVSTMAARMTNVQIESGAAKTSHVASSLAPPPGILPPRGLLDAPRDTPPPSSVLSPQPPPTTTTTTSTAILPPPSATTTISEEPKQQQQQQPAKMKRTQTRLDEQPGKLYANGVPASIHRSTITTTTNNNYNTTILTIPPRRELTARWILPLSYLRQRVLRRTAAAAAGTTTTTTGTTATTTAKDPNSTTIREAIQHLTVGLYRVGMAENGGNASIVSKCVVISNDDDDDAGNGDVKNNNAADDKNDNNNARREYPYDITAEVIHGTIPFYSPRTPGHVIFRMYFDDEPHVTLASGPIVRVSPDVLEYGSALRFVLSNFKKKSGSSVSLSPVHSFTSVLESFTAANTIAGGGGSSGGMNHHEESGRAAWGCICETRKLVEYAHGMYTKKREELNGSERELDEADRVKRELMELSVENVVVKSTGEKEEEGGGGGTVVVVSEERQKLMGERYTNERKWKEMQLAYAALLESIVKNESTRFLFKRDMLQKIRLEYELWCPLCESFAPNPLNGDTAQPGSFLVQVVNRNVSIQSFQESRQSMQREMLKFIPIKDPLPSMTASRAKAKDVLLDFSNAMKALYMDEYRVSDAVHERREGVRSGIEQVVIASGAFPEGTRVAVFGSSANGFGSPSSDLDLCLQIPQSATDFTKENGVAAMTQLAEKFTEAGMTDVDTVRLTARIPIVKFNYPYINDGKTIFVECDLSLQNPLACLNTALLNTYSKISPDTCILASVIKRWAKMRDINNPAMHTLSSYGYVLMLLYYLTSSEPSHDGFVVDPGHTRGMNPPLLVNLQRVDPSWAQNPAGPYREINEKPQNQYCIHQHPTEPNYLVNTYFYRSELERLEQYHTIKSKSGPCLGVLLASFFRYFAYEFDYKKFVVALDTKHGEFKEKEIKAEDDGWSLYKPGLAIEDPFEHFYDVAHVVKTSNFHHIQQELALAYSKIASVVCGDRRFVSGRDLIDLICDPVSTDDD